MRLKIQTPPHTFSNILSLLSEHTVVHVQNERRCIISCDEPESEILGRVFALGATVSSEEPYEPESAPQRVSFEFDGVQYTAPQSQLFETGFVMLPDRRLLKIDTSWREVKAHESLSFSEMFYTRAVIAQ